MAEYEKKISSNLDKLGGGIDYFVVTTGVSELEPLYKLIESYTVKNYKKLCIANKFLINHYMQFTVKEIEGVQCLVFTDINYLKSYNRVVKRVIDIVGAVCGILIFTPVVLVMCGIIWFQDRGGVFFVQKRVGMSGRPFNMIKLRSMKLNSEIYDNVKVSTNKKDDRLLPIGLFMRRYNIDELPQFLNVLFGKMSLVGPRPERVYHSEKLSEKLYLYNYRYSVKPGMTGYAQINGLRGDTDLQERILHDVYYIQNWSFSLDVEILLRTLFLKDNSF